MCIVCSFFFFYGFLYDKRVSSSFSRSPGVFRTGPKHKRENKRPLVSFGPVRTSVSMCVAEKEILKLTWIREFFFLIVAGSFSIGYGLWHTIDACILRTGHWRSRSRFYFVTLICTTGHHFTFYFDTSLYCALCSHVHDADPYAATAASNRGTPMDRPR